MDVARWRQETLAAMTRAGLSQAELAARLHVQYETLRNWLRTPPRAAPGLEYISAIAREVGMDPVEAFVALGVLSQGLSRLAVSNLELRAEVRALREHLHQVTALETSPASAIVNTALATGRWAAAAWPTTNGPDHTHQVRAADRVQIVPVGDDHHNAGAALADAVAADPDLGPLIAALHAERTRWEEDDPQEFPVPEAMRGPEAHLRIARYVIPVFAADRAPSPERVPLRVANDSIIVVGLMDHTSVQATAAVIARALGWGLTGSRSARHAVFGPVGATTVASSAWTSNQERNFLLRDVLKNPPAGYIWTHRGTPVMEPKSPGSLGKEDVPPELREPHALVAHLASGEPVPHIILLSETNDMLRYEATMTRVRWTVDHLVGFRDELMAALSPLIETGDAMVAQVRLIDPNRYTTSAAVRQAYWARTRDISRIILRRLLTERGDGLENFYFRDKDAQTIVGALKPQTSSISVAASRKEGASS